MNAKVNRYLGYLPAFVWALVILQLSTGPSSDFPPYLILGVLPFDKAGHFAAYFLFTILLAAPILMQYAQAENRYNSASFAIIIPILYGLLMELLQGFVIMDRNLEFYDLVANSAGSLVGFTLVYLAAKR